MSDRRLNQSLNEIIDENQRRRRPDARSGRGASRGARNDRKSEPYDSGRMRSVPARRERELRPYDSNYEVALKFLLNNDMSGSVIGNGGSAIKDLIEITDANIHIGNVGAPYPGTQDRILFIAGSEASLYLASALIWEMVGQQTHSSTNGMALVWNPAAAKASPGEYDDQEVECKITVPAACGGRILGRGGAVFRKMTNDHQVETKMSPVQESDLLQERVISIAGTVSGCMAFTAELLQKMLEAPEECKFVHSGTAYPRDLLASAGLLRDSHRDRDRERDRDTSVGRRGYGDRDAGGRRNIDDDSSRRGGRSNGLGSALSSSRSGAPRGLSSNGSFIAETLSERSVIEVAVPNNLVGAILGIRGSKLAEITSLSGASVKISDKNEFIEGTTSRLVTITGSPANAQTAHTLILHKIRQEVESTR